MAEYKNLYTVYDKDSGLISLSTKIYDDADGAYGKVLAEREMRFVNHAGAHHANPSRHFVPNGNLVNRPQFPVLMNGTKFQAEKDRVVITGIPKQAYLTIFAFLRGSPEEFHHSLFDGPSCSFKLPTPGLYSIRITKHPYRDWERQIEVTE